LTVGAWGSLFGSLLIAIYGVGAILVGIFPTDRIDSPADVWSQSTTGMIHMTVALVSFLCVIVGMFALTRTFSTGRAAAVALALVHAFLSQRVSSLLHASRRPSGWAPTTVARCRDFGLVNYGGGQNPRDCRTHGNRISRRRLTYLLWPRADSLRRYPQEHTVFSSTKKPPGISETTRGHASTARRAA